MWQSKKIAIVYDWIDKWGGVERVLLTLYEMYPEAEFFTTYFDPEKAPWAKNIKIKTSFMQNLPSFIRRNRVVSLPFYPYAFESFDFVTYDLVISVTSAFAKSVITRPETFHICYLLTPTRYLWSSTDDYLKNKFIKSILSPYLAKLREWDFIAAQRPDKIISLSKTVADRCKKYYQRESDIIFPPFDINYWKKIKKNVILGTNKVRTPESLLDSGPHFAEASRGKRARLPAGEAGSSLARMTTGNQKYFLVVSRLEPYKRIDLVIKTFNDSIIGTSLQRPLQTRTKDFYGYLVIVGEGSEQNRLKRMSSDNILFLNNLDDKELGYLYSNAEALIMPQEEDFGYVSLEAQFFGCPVIAYKKGGAVETVIEGETGIFFNEQTSESIQSTLKRFDMVKYDLRQKIAEFGLKHIEKFNKKIFINKFNNLLKPLSS